MSPTWTLSVICVLFGASYAAEVCFTDLGCFSDLPPWGGTPQRPATVLPWDPEELGTRFLLFTQKNRYYQEIKMDNTIQASNYYGGRKTRFVIPGLLEKDDEDWPQEMCKVMLTWENVNCIAVEWKKGVRSPFAQAVNNARVLGAQVAAMTTFLMGRYKQKAERFHLIGHGLGAHVAGDVGSRIGGIARITGLDPIEPYFQETNASVRLDTTDAVYVDVIHTDGLPFFSKLGLGMSERIGHIDFYPNGGELMPGCQANRGDPADLDDIWQGTAKFHGCNHRRAYEYYMESMVKPQGFVGYRCADAQSFAAGVCFPCPDDKCPQMGLNVDRFGATDDASKFFFSTGSSKPFGRYTYRVRLTLDGPSWPNPGFMYVALAGDSDTTGEHQLHRGTLKPGRTYEMLLHTEVELYAVKEVTFRWNNHIINPMNPKYGATRVEVQRGKDKKITVFCSTENVVENAIQTVLPCQS